MKSLQALSLTASALATFSTVQAQAPVDSNILFDTTWGDWVWCCQDADGRCPNACAAIEDPELIAKYGPDSDFFKEEKESGSKSPSKDMVDSYPDGFFTNAEFVTQKCTMIHGFDCCESPAACGDPHFKTWTGDKFDYQGQCELKLLSAPHFGHGTGLDIHIRTKKRYNYSFIESAAIKIGTDVLEIGSWGEYFLNGVESATLPAYVGGFPASYFMRSEKEHIFEIFLGDNRKILVKNFKDWVSVTISHPHADDFLFSEGLLGDYTTGKTVARDGTTVMEDANAFGQEWQVRADEPQLFQRAEFEPQYPAKCMLPQGETNTETQRRLAESGVSKEQAEAACAHVPSHQEFCVQDVLATGDLEMANAN